jgi:acetyl esterase/lipase
MVRNKRSYVSYRTIAFFHQFSYIDMKTFRLFALLLLISFVNIKAQEKIDLYPGAIPNSKTSDMQETVNERSGFISGVTKPTLEIFLPERDKATGAAVVICPGGAYRMLAYQTEGVRTANEFVKNGVAVFLLKYRLPSDAIMTDKKIGPLQDAQQAIKVVRDNASKWGIDTNRVGIMGFSAGGHLASTAATHFEKSLISNPENTNLRPDFQILIYPVISMQDNLTHADSRANLLGKEPVKDIIDLYSNELQVKENTPPAYITHTGDDKTVDVDNSILYYESLRHHQVPAEMHLYARGGHGFVLSQPAGEWMLPLFRWMKSIKMINN